MRSKTTLNELIKELDLTEGPAALEHNELFKSRKLWWNKAEQKIKPAEFATALDQFLLSGNENVLRLKISPYLANELKETAKNHPNKLIRKIIDSLIKDYEHYNNDKYYHQMEYAEALIGVYRLLNNPTNKNFNAIVQFSETCIGKPSQILKNLGSKLLCLTFSLALAAFLTFATLPLSITFAGISIFTAAVGLKCRRDGSRKYCSKILHDLSQAPLFKHLQENILPADSQFSIND